MTVTLVCAREPLPTGPSVFLAGPTPRAGGDVPSWRPAAIEHLDAQWDGPDTLTVLTPESRGGKRAAHYDDQVGWETAARRAASAVLFWIPRDLETLPGFTTNVEFGLDAPSGRAVLGAPSTCPNPERNRYLVYVAQRYGLPVCETLPETVAAALALVRQTARTVSLHGPQTGCPDRPRPWGHPAYRRPQDRRQGPQQEDPVTGQPLHTHTPTGEITLPSTIRGIRAALPADKREAFNEAVENADLREVHAVLRGYLMEVMEERDPQMNVDTDELRHQEQVRRSRGERTA